MSAQKVEGLSAAQPHTQGIRYAGPLPRTTNSHGLPLQDGSQGEERCSNVRETTVDGRELTVAEGVGGNLPCGDVEGCHGLGLRFSANE